MKSKECGPDQGGRCWEQSPAPHKDQDRRQQVQEQIRQVKAAIGRAPYGVIQSEGQPDQGPVLAPVRLKEVVNPLPGSVPVPVYVNEIVPRKGRNQTRKEHESGQGEYYRKDQCGTVSTD